MSDGILSLDSAAGDDVDCNLRRGVCQAEVFPHFGVRCVLRSSPIGFGGLDSIGPYTWAFGPVRTDAPHLGSCAGAGAEILVPRYSYPQSFMVSQSL